MDEQESESPELQPGEAMIVIDPDLRARLVVHHAGGDDEPVSPAVLWATALTLAINDKDEPVIQQLVARLLERMDRAGESEEA